jgi:hypothetical protein
MHFIRMKHESGSVCISRADYIASAALDVANCYSALTCLVEAGNSFCLHHMRLQNYDSYARTLLGIS